MEPLTSATYVLVLEIQMLDFVWMKIGNTINFPLISLKVFPTTYHLFFYVLDAIIARKTTGNIVTIGFLGMKCLLQHLT
jgi:hypothetical protein